MTKKKAAASKRGPIDGPPGFTPGTTIQNCHFVGVQWDKPALDIVQTVARTLENLVALFRSQGLQVPMVEVREPWAAVNADAKPKP